MLEYGGGSICELKISRHDDGEIPLSKSASARTVSRQRVEVVYREDVRTPEGVSRARKATGQTTPIAIAVPRHLGSGNRRNVGCVDNPHSLMLESASTSGAGVLSHRHLYKRLGDFIGRRRLSVAERPHTRLAAGTLGSAASPTLGERSHLALSCSLELGDLLVQLFLGRRQLRNLPLQLRDQPHQFVTLRGREVFGLTHSQSIKTCSVPHNPLPTPIPLINYLWLIKSMAWIGASVAIFVPLLAWNILKLARRERSIDEQLRMAVENAVWVDDQIKSFLHNALSNPWYGVAKCYAFGSIVGRYPTRDVDVVIQFDSSKQGRVRICRERLRSIESSFQEFHCLKLHVQTFLLAENEALDRFLNKAGFHERIL